MKWGRALLFWNSTVLRQGSPRMRTILRTCSVTRRTLRSFQKEPEIKQGCILEHILRIANKLWKCLTEHISCDISFFS